MASDYVRGDFTEKTVRDAIAELQKAPVSLTPFEKRFVASMADYIDMYDSMAGHHSVEGKDRHLGITTRQYNLLITIRDEKA